MVVSAPDILMPPQAVLHPEGFYQHGLAARLDGLRGLFPRTRVTLALAVRQASGLVPDLLAGGTLTDGELEIQGDQLKRLEQYLKSQDKELTATDFKRHSLTV